MKKALVLALVVLLVIGSAAAAYAKSQKVALIDAAKDRSAGFVIFNNPDPADEDYNLTMLVSLKQGEPNVKYVVFLHFQRQIPGFMCVGDLRTNRRGRGNLEYHGVTFMPPGFLWQVWVELGHRENGSFIIEFYTDPVEILLK